MMDNRRSFLKKAALLTGAAGVNTLLPASIQKALAINPAPGSTWQDAEHIVFLMQENRSFDHCFGTLQGVRGFNDPRAITLPNHNQVWLQTNANGETYVPFRLDMHRTKATWMGGLPHSWTDQVDARNKGRYDQWLIAKQYGGREFKDLPMTMGYYTREDIPFYYALADAFTVCDQHFCSSLTGTTPNRLYFWTGKLREHEQAKARVRNSDTDYDTNASWTSFPERLEQNGVSWRIYQNELSVGAGFTAEQDAWLANFTDNPIEWFSQYHVKLSPGYIAYLQKAPQLVAAEIEQLQGRLKSAEGKKAEALQKQIDRQKQYLERVTREQKIYTRERYEQLPAFEKGLHDRAFTTNRNDPFYHQLTTLDYREGNVKRSLTIPKGDILHQFRKEVGEGRLPTVSWLVAPEKFSDHPSAPWFGAWYVSEVLDILTKNPEVWKKTIFILTYDENDGYFDHVPPFVAPYQPGTGKTSAGIDTATEFVSLQQEQQYHEPKDCREGPIGLGYRVPMVIVSPWSRGGWVNSQVFDHTSSLQFLEKFLRQKYGKNIQETNISDWRRCVCGDLTSVFRTYNGEKISRPRPLEKDSFIEGVYNAKFKAVPDGWKALTAQEIEQVNKHPQGSSRMPKQEKGIRSSCALPYELLADGKLSGDKKTFEITFAAGNKIFGERSAGSPFNVYAPGNYISEQGGMAFEPVRTWSYAVKSGDQVKDEWPLKEFENGEYHLRVYGPNGFFREFRGDKNDPDVSATLEYEQMRGGAGKLTGNLLLHVRNWNQQNPCVIEVKDFYTERVKTVSFDRNVNEAAVLIELKDSFGWYDIALRIKNSDVFIQRYAGRVETGRPGKTDPMMGGLVTTTKDTPLSRPLP